MISTHILDTSLGNPAAGVTVQLEKQGNEMWQKIDEQRTNGDGRIVFNCPQEAGNYRLIFFVEDYFQLAKQESFFLNTPVAFKITNTQRKYHVPLLLNPFGFSTYRGS